jgi:pyruvate-ferredoxin/flavodoxin oxidoreductase
MSEVRYSSLPLSFPERAEKLFKEAEENARIRYEKLVAQRDMYNKK